MTVPMKKPKSPAAAKSGANAKPARVVSEVDVLIARLKKIRKGQAGALDVRRAIEDGRA